MRTNKKALTDLKASNKNLISGLDFLNSYYTIEILAGINGNYIDVYFKKKITKADQLHLQTLGWTFTEHYASYTPKSLK